LGAEAARDLIELVTADREAIWGERVRATNMALRKALALVIDGYQGKQPSSGDRPLEGK
ncbi:MAG TPA: hypothetical protein GX518_04110, partial [Firmicutes bacterium]|nr:hypothetical protein [Bacillota bacterium]